MYKIQFDVNFANSKAIDVVNDVLPDWWMDVSHTKMKSGLPIGSTCAAHRLPTEAVGSSVDRSCPLFM